MIVKLIKNILSHFYNKKPTVENIDQDGWDERYRSGEWDYLDQLHELAHYSVIVGYCQHLFPDGKFLDVGCGEGILQQRLSILPYEKYTGIDLSKLAVSNATEKYADHRTKFIAANAEKFDDQCLYDLIIFNESLYCFDDAVKVLNHYKKSLTPDGLFVISMHVQEVSEYHWEEIGRDFKIVDSVDVKNGENISWKCKLVKPD